MTWMIKCDICGTIAEGIKKPRGASGRPDGWITAKNIDVCVHICDECVN